MTPFVRATLDAVILISLRVERDTEAPSEADCIMLDAMEHLMASIQDWPVKK